VPFRDLTVTSLPHEEKTMSSSDSDSVGVLRHDKQGHVGVVTFDNPTKFNAVNYDMWCALPRVMAEFAADPDIRVVMLTGAGLKAFVSGADISQFKDRREGNAAEAYNQATAAGYAAVLNCPKPTVAKIRGICMGGGLGLALNCDIRICSDDARFRMPAARLGLGYAFEGIQRFVDVLGMANTADLFFSARIFGGADALQMGLVKQVIGVQNFDAEVDAYVQMIGENAPLTLAAAKRCLLEISKNPDQRDLALARSLVQACFASRDYQEGREAFAQKRTPQFQGR
jgi:enoyl-CoA hydratase/carnithine racemase